MSTERSVPPGRPHPGSRRPLRAFAVAASLLSLVAACSGGDRIQPAPVVRPSQVDLGSAEPQFIAESFQELYPRLLQLRRDAGQRPADWAAHFEHHWVRWSGVVASVTRTGLTIRERPDTTTFDVSLVVDGDHLAELRRVRPGQTVTFVGRLIRYDDVFSTLYLDHGDVIAATPDAGTR